MSAAVDVGRNVIVANVGKCENENGFKESSTSSSSVRNRAVTCNSNPEQF